MKTHSKFLALVLSLALSLSLLPAAALAAQGHPTLPGVGLNALWAIPFACMLLSIAVMPLAAPHFWERHFGKISVFWGLAFLLPCAFVFGPSVALYELLHIIILDYIPFIILLFSLFTVAGGVRRLPGGAWLVMTNVVTISRVALS